MSAPLFRSIVAVVVALASAAAEAKEDKWIGTQILPLTGAIQLNVSGQITAGVHDIHWPATVERHNGQWLWICDRGGYNSRQVAGWISTDDVVKFDAAQQLYTDRLQQGETAIDYWLRGVYWENHDEPTLAIADYLDALALEPNFGDAEMRLGRLEADASPTDRSWEKERFQRATTLAGARPRVFFDWGEALLGCYLETKSEKDYQDAKAQFLAATTFDQHWPAGYFGLGQLELVRGQHLQEVGGEANPILRDAIANFSEVIRLSPSMYDAYAQRAKASQLLHDLPTARRSAHKACELTDFRNPPSLEILAGVYADQGLFERAAYYANKSAEYTAEEKRHTMLTVRDKYLAKLAESQGGSAGQLPGWLQRPPGGGIAAQQTEAYHVPDFIPRSRSAVGD